jgi:integrase
LGDVAKGRDPAADRKAATLEAKRKAAHEALTLGALLDQWSALRLADKRESYAVEAVRAIKVAFPKQLPLPAADLDRAGVVRVLDNITCYQWAIRRGSIVTNPFVNLPVAATVKRDRVLTNAELRSIWQATDKPGSFNSIVRMLMLTAQRRDEVANMAWSELSDDLSTWTIPANRAKNGQTNIVPMAPQVQAMLRATPRYAENPLVFPGERGAFSGWSKSKAALDKVSGVKEWRLHDIRRTAATGLQRLGIRLETTEAVLNHIGGSRAGIVGIYQKYDYADEKRAALCAWGKHVTAIIEGHQAAEKVVAFAGRGRSV